MPRNLDGLAKRKFGALVYFTWRTIRDASASPNATNVQNVFRSIIFFLHQCVIASRSSRLQPLTEIPGIGLGNKIVAIESRWFGKPPHLTQDWRISSPMLVASKDRSGRIFGGVLDLRRYGSRRNLVVSPTLGRSLGRLRVFVCMPSTVPRITIDAVLFAILLSYHSTEQNGTQGTGSRN